MNPHMVILVVGVAAGALPAWWLTADHYQGVIAKEHEAQQRVVIEQQEQNLATALAYAEQITKAGADHDKNTRTIRSLSRELDGLRVNFPTCPLPGDTEAGADSGGGARALSDAVDAEFARFQRETGALVERCDTLNIDAIRSNSVGGN